MQNSRSPWPSGQLLPVQDIQIGQNALILTATTGSGLDAWNFSEEV